MQQFADILQNQAPEPVHSNIGSYEGDSFTNLEHMLVQPTTA